MAPAQMRAWVVGSEQQPKLEVVDTPKPKAREILLRITTIGLNPTDWKTAGRNPPGSRVGSDAVGIVEELGSDVPADKVKKGERRAALRRAGANGSFGEWAVYDWDVTTLLTDDITDEQGATIGVPYYTAVQGLYEKLKIPVPPRDGSPGKASGTIFVHSGSSVVGCVARLRSAHARSQFVIQLAKHSGLTVVATASKHNFDLLKSLGADVVIDRSAEDYVEQVKAHQPLYLYDAYSESGSTSTGVQALVQGGKATMLLPPDKSISRKDVEVLQTAVYTLTGVNFGGGEVFIAARPEERQVILEWADRLLVLVKRGAIRFPKTRNVGSLEDIVKGLELLKRLAMASQNMRAVVLQADKSVKVEVVEKPTPLPNEVRLRMRTLGQIPGDFKTAFFHPVGSRVGSDGVGIVESLGKDVPPGLIKIGDRRVVFRRNPEQGAFAEYSCYDPASIVSVPDTITDEQAVSLGVPFWTAVQALFHRLLLPLPPTDDSRGKATGTLLIHGASSAIGVFAIQLAKLSGVKVIATASAHNLSYLRELGADVAIDRSSDYFEQVKSEGPIDYLLDLFTEQGSIQRNVVVLRSGGKAVAMMPFDRTTLPRDDIAISLPAVYTLAGQSIRMPGVSIDPRPEEPAQFRDWCKRLDTLIGAGKLVFPRARDMGGLEDVNAGLELMKSGGVSATKLVYTI